MSLYISSSPNKIYICNNEFGMPLAESINKHRSISLLSKKLSPTFCSFNNNLTFQDSNKFNNLKTCTNIKTEDKNLSINSNEDFYSSLPKVSIDLNETFYLKLEEITELRKKLNELPEKKIKLLNKNYVKELKTLRNKITDILLNNKLTNSCILKDNYNINNNNFNFNNNEMNTISNPNCNLNEINLSTANNKGNINSNQFISNGVQENLSKSCFCKIEDKPTQSKEINEYACKNNIEEGEDKK